MKKVIIILSLISMFLISAAFAMNRDSGTKSITVGPSGSGWFRLGVSANDKVRLSAKADHGKAYIEVESPEGRTVARGVNSLSFESGKKKGRYKITLINKTNKRQKVTVSYTATDDLF
ncbi:MAG: hypothetical protein R2681_01390 [Pyrinomonadaceae bacterium]